LGAVERDGARIKDRLCREPDLKAGALDDGQ
jgi:hypothetical protein